MARISREKMKKDEERVIKILSTSANESIDRIAKKCGFSRQKTWRIITRLEKDRIIWGYHAVTDSEKLHIKNFILLVKASMKPMKDVAEIIIKREIEPLAEEIGVTIDCSLYLNGAYDWIVFFDAKDIKQAKKFCNLMSVTYRDFIADMVLLEQMFPLKKCGIMNPDFKRLKEFA
ncbi:MAG: Lrp/AsnC family transcriptional regulator [Methanobacteriota archaeon]